MMKFCWAVVTALCAMCPPGAATEPWRADGPNGASVYSIAQAPDGTVLAGIDGGLSRYNEATGSWEHVGLDGWKVGPLFAASSGVVFAHLSGGGCIVVEQDEVSFDGGLTWEEVDGLPDAGAARFVETPDGLVWAAANWSGSLYRWDPDATRWLPHFPMVASDFIIDVAVTSDGALLVLAETQQPMASAVLRSDDSGASWSLPLVVTPGLTSLAAGANGLAVAAGRNSAENGVTFFVSRDAGLSWSEAPCSDDACAGMRQVTRLAVLQDGVVAAAGDDADDPSSRLIVSPGAVEPWRVARRFQFTPRDLYLDREGALWVVGLPYIWRSTDSGTTFEHVADGLNQTIVTGLAEADNRILAVVGGITSGGYSGWNPHPGAAGLHVSTDGGATWKPTPVWQANEVTIGLTGAALVATNVGLSRSVDGGVTWRTVPGTEHLRVAAVSEDLLGNLCLIRSSATLSCSDDGGSSWYGDLALHTWHSALAVTLDGTFLVGSSDVVLRSVDRGRTWQPTPLMEDVGLLAVSPGNVVYATFGRFDNSEIAYSRDAGLSWQAFDTPAVNPTAIAFHQAWGPVIGDDYRAFYSADRYATWTRVDIPADALLVHEDRLVGAGRWSGIWFADLPSRTRFASGRVAP